LTPPHPIASPRPPDPGPDELKTDPGLRRVERRVKRSATLQSLVTAAGAVGAAVIGAIIFFDNRVQAQVDAGLSLQAQKHEVLQHQVNRLETNQDRLEQKVDLLLDAARVPMWKRPLDPAPDGGR
jgi:hypothetical protein